MLDERTPILAQHQASFFRNPRSFVIPGGVGLYFFGDNANDSLIAKIQRQIVRFSAAGRQEIGNLALAHNNANARSEQIALSIVLARQGASPALGQLLDHYRPYLLRLANDELSSSLVPKASPSDLVQETFFQAARDFPKFAGATEEELRGWLRQILIDNLRDTAKRYRAVQKRCLNLEVPLDGALPDQFSAQQAVAGGPTPSARLISAENREAVLAAIERLPADYQQVIELRSLQGLPFEQVGQCLERSSDAARKLWSRAIEQLADEMVRHEPR